MKKRIISMVAALCMIMALLPQSMLAATANAKLSFGATGSDYYDLTEHTFTAAEGVTATPSTEAGIGKIITVTSTGSTAEIYQEVANPKTNKVKYFTFMYKYTGSDTVSKIKVETSKGDSFIGQATLNGDGNWHTAICKMPTEMLGKAGNLTKVTHIYTAESPASKTFVFARYSAYNKDPQIASINEQYTLACDALPPKYTSTTGNYSIVSTEWSDENGPVSGNIESGHTYTAKITMKANADYIFTEDASFSSSFMGAEEVTIDSISDDNFENTIVVKAVYDTSLGFESAEIENNATDVNPATRGIVATFTRDIDATSVAGSIQITPSITWHPETTTSTKEVKIAFDDTLSLNTKYTITYTNGIKSAEGYALTPASVSFTTASSYPAPQIVKSTVANGEKNVAIDIPKIDIEFDLAMDSATITKQNITVSPEVSYTVTPAAKGFGVTFGEALSRETQYTISWNGITSSYGSETSEKSLSFTTVENMKNLFKNSNVNDEDISAFNPDAHPDDAVRLAEGDNNIIRWNVGNWGMAGIFQLVNWQAGHKYFASVDVKATETHELQFDFHYPVPTTDNQYFFTGKTETPAGQWVTMSTTYTIPQNLKPGMENTANKRLGLCYAGTPSARYYVYIDNFVLYDMTVAPTGTAKVVSSSVANGATEVPVMGTEIVLQFDKPMNPISFSNITTSPDNKVLSTKISEDLTSCTVKLDRLAPSTTYTLNVPASVTTMHDEATESFSTSFTTYTVADGALSVEATTPLDNAEKVATNNLTVQIDFNTYVEPDTLNGGNITVTPDAVKEIKALPKGVQILFDNEKTQSGTNYTVSLSGDIKSLKNNGLTPFTMSFKTKSKEDVLSTFNQISNQDDMKTFMENEFGDLLMPCDLYDYLLENNSAVLPIIYERLLSMGSAATDAQLLEKVKNATNYAVANNGNEAEITKLLESDSLGLKNDNVYKVYTDVLTPAAKSVLVNKIARQSFLPMQDIKNACGEQLILCGIANMNGWESVKEILTYGQNIFTGTSNMTQLLSNINALSPAVATSIYNKLQSREFANLDALYVALATEYDAAKQGGGSTGTGGGSTGGGAGGSGGNKTAESIMGGLGHVTVAPNVNVTETKVEPFDDLAQVAWAKDAIIKFYDGGIVSGRGEGIFAPFDSVKREEFVKMFICAIGEFDEESVAEFEDLPKNHWSGAYVASAVNKGFIAGVGDGRFGVGFNISREDMAVIIYRYLANMNIGTADKDEFADINDAADYAKEAISFLQRAGIVNADENGNYRPKANSTRAEAVVLLNQMLAACGE